jgi:hypothetical protein
MKALRGCASWAKLELEEHLEEEEKGEPKDDDKEAEKQQRATKLLIQASMVARCTRHATSCDQELFCLRGGYITNPLPDFLTIPPAKPPPPPPTPAPTWSIPYHGEGKDPWVDPPPWKGKVSMMPGDSPSCTACAIQRCPDFAYYCMGALGNEADCPGGDCCQGLRECVRDCGGYEPYARVWRFDMCMHRCQWTRPNAVQQLVNLQHCGDVACDGCSTFDKKVSTDQGAP